MSAPPLQPAIPEGIASCDGLIDALDRCFALGFSRLADPEHDALGRLKNVFAGTPLAPALDDAIQGVLQASLNEHHFAAIAAARAALQGSQHDALRAALSPWIGPPQAPPTPPASEPAANGDEQPPAAWFESTRHWLMEVAINGLNQLQTPNLLPFDATLTQLQSHPHTAGLAMLLTGLLDEWLAALPIQALPDPPLRRWVDLWTRAMISAVRPSSRAQGRTVQGVLYPLVAQLNHHPKALAAVIYALLDVPNEPTQLVRCTLSTFKVDLITNADMWPLFGPQYAPLLTALGQHKSLKIRSMTLTPEGDLLWDGDADLSAPFNLWDLAEKHLTAACPRPTRAPIDRHPAQIAELVYAAPTPKLPVSARLCHATEAEFAPHKSQNVQNADKALGLLCYDAQAWHFLPLAFFTAKPKPASAHAGALAAQAPQTLARRDSPIAILRERASRLLRPTPSSKRA